MWSININRIIELHNTEQLSHRPDRCPSTSVLILVRNTDYIPSLINYLEGNRLDGVYDKSRKQLRFTSGTIIEFRCIQATPLEVTMVSVMFDICIFYGRNFPKQLLNEIFPAQRKGGMFFNIAPIEGELDKYKGEKK